MQKNLVLAVVLSSLVYIGWYSFMDKKAQRQPQAPQTTQAGQTPAAANGAQAAAPLQTQQPAPAAQQTVLPLDWQNKAVRIKAGKAEYALHEESASLASAVYEGPVSSVELVPDPTRGFFRTTLPAKFKLKSHTADSAEFVAEQGPVRITKKFTFSPDNGLNTLKITVRNTSSSSQPLYPWELMLGPGLNTVESEMDENEGELTAAYAYAKEGRKHPIYEKIKDEPASHDWIWTGLNNRYFLAALAGSDFSGTRPVRRLEEVGENDETPLLAVPIPGVQLDPGQKMAWSSSFYLGPKDYTRLKQLGLGLDRAVDFGFFAPLAKLANSSLVYFHNLTGNHGVAIIIISIIIQILLTPLSLKSYKAMAVMKKIQPEMKAIQTRYKKDPQRMNQEVMALYKRHGTNPLGGCLPMLLQIPVFFALFTALRNSWDLHGAPFIFWIQDLSAKDPYYVLPIVMGGIMFLQQSLNPQTSDPAQATMMKWMPVVFTFMFLTFPSGLVLYWLINSTWGFAQTMYLQKKMG